jgi:hypothetical protein
VQTPPLFKQLLLGLRVVWVGEAGVHRTDIRTARGLVSSYALAAPVRVNNVNGLAFPDSCVRALGLTSPAAYTVFRNIIGHNILLAILIALK